MGLIVGIFCENTMKIALETEREINMGKEELRRNNLLRLRRAFESSDTDETGEISRAEFAQAIVDNDDVIESLTALGLAEERDLFDVLDADRSGSLEFQEFFDGVTLIMKGQEA